MPVLLTGTEAAVGPAPARPLMRTLVRGTAGHVHLAYQDQPARSAGPDDLMVVLLHQVPSSGRMWYPVGRLLPTAWVAPDLLGYGDSDDPEQQLDLAEHAAAIGAALAALPVAAGRRIALIGHHSGAALAAQLALIAGAQPDLGLRVAGVGLVGYPLYESWRGKLTRLGALIQPIDVDVDGAGLAAPWAASTQAFEPQTGQDERLCAFADRLRGGAAWYSGYVQLLGADLHGLLEQLARLPVPKCVLSATADGVSGTAEQVAALLGVPLRPVEGGPWVTVEHPADVAAQICDWLRELAPADGGAR